MGSLHYPGGRAVSEVAMKLVLLNLSTAYWMKGLLDGQAILDSFQQFDARV